MLPIDNSPPAVQSNQGTSPTDESEQAPPSQASSATGIKRSVWMTPLPPHIKFRKTTNTAGMLVAFCSKTYTYFIKVITPAASKRGRDSPGNTTQGSPSKKRNTVLIPEGEEVPMDEDKANDDGDAIPIPSKEPTPTPPSILPGHSPPANPPTEVASENSPLNHSSRPRPPGTDASEADVEIILQDDQTHTIPSHLKATDIPATDQYHIMGMNGLRMRYNIAYSGLQAHCPNSYRGCPGLSS